MIYKSLCRKEVRMNPSRQQIRVRMQTRIIISFRIFALLAFAYFSQNHRNRQELAELVIKKRIFESHAPLKKCAIRR
jgi:hypothetical protein